MGECWIWNQGCTAGGQPQARFGNTSALVRRKVFEFSRGVPPRKKWFVVAKCQDKLCVSPKCATELSGAQYQRHLNLIGAVNTPSQNAARVAATRRRASTRLTIEIAAEIKRRVRAGEDRAAVAADFNITSSWASRIAAGRGWRPTVANSSVFHQRA